MKQFTYIVQSPHGLHARPAGLLAKQAKTYTDTVITLTKGNKTVKASQLLRVLNLEIQCGGYHHSHRGGGGGGYRMERYAGVLPAEPVNLRPEGRQLP